jgi:hypothetical protein
MGKATRRLMSLAEALEHRISEVGGNPSLAMHRIIADMDAHRLEVTWEDHDGAIHNNVLPVGCTAWAHARIEWSKSTAMWRRESSFRLVPWAGHDGVRPEFVDNTKWAFCIKVRAAKKKKLSTTVAAETRCKEWLIRMMTASPTARPESKSKYLSKAKSLFGVSRRSFDHAWKNAIKTTGARWDRPGAPKTS